MLTRLGVKSRLTDSKNDLDAAQKIILPGIGSYDRGMEALHKHGFVDTIKAKGSDPNVKILGICLGMQMLGNSSEEGKLDGLSLIKGKVKKFEFSKVFPSPKIPHMGWNYAISQSGARLFEGFDEVPRFYFTHSYHFECDNSEDVAAYTPYGFNFTCAIQKGNIYGVQFHPEKSHRFGLHLLKNFVEC